MRASMEWLRRWRWEVRLRTAELGSGAITLPADPKRPSCATPRLREEAIPAVISASSSLALRDPGDPAMALAMASTVIRRRDLERLSIATAVSARRPIVPLLIHGHCRAGLVM